MPLLCFMIKAKRERGGKVMDGSFTETQWKSGVPQNAGWKPAAEFNLQPEQAEAKQGRENVNVALQEQLLAKENEVSGLKEQLLSAHTEIEEMKAQIVVLEANQKKKPGRQPNEN